MSQAHGADLARYARASIREALGGPAARAPAGEWFARPGAAFVTLRDRRGELHGCIGSLEPRRPLADDVRENAVAAALDDPRAPPLALGGVDDLVIEVSVLSPLERLAVEDEGDALAKLAGLRGGVVLRWRGRRATFLPQVWERMSGAEEFVLHLKRKAGVADDFWHPDVEVWHYTVDKYTDR